MMMTKEQNEKAAKELSKLTPDKEYKLADYPKAAFSRVRLDLSMNYNLAVTMPTRETFILNKIS